jgi:disulfide bond formation protein DsbB
MKNSFMFVIDVQADIFSSQHAAYLFYLFIFAKFAVYIAYLMLDYVIHYAPCCIQRNPLCVPWFPLSAGIS